MSSRHQQVNASPSGLTAFLDGAVALALIGSTGFAMAQVDCDTMVGPARPDCYVGLARLHRQKSEITASVARQRTDAAILRNVTNKRPKPMSARKADRTEP